VAARRSVWSVPEVQELAARFVPVADEVGRLQRGEEADAVFFRSFCELGHYGGRTSPSNTRQGIYAVTASGTFLASINTRDPAAMAKMMTEALARFDALPAASRSGERAALDPNAIRRFENRFPEDGLVLRVVTRDLPRPTVSEGWRGTAWNVDHAWFRRAEVAAFVPAPEPGAEAALPDAVLLRLVRAHFVDNVRGQTPALGAEHVPVRRLVARTERVDGDVQVLALEGNVKVERRGNWATRGHGPVSPQQLGYDAALLGDAHYDRAAGRFVAFRLLAVGQRQGATEFNQRDDDRGPAPMGIALELAPAGTSRVAPSLHHVYGW
jgi:hypothetical protein